jgi:Zn finger protein HypA/HybF involved in hydrogenase expression
MRKKTSPIWTTDSVTFRNYYDRSHSITEMLLFFGIRNHGNNSNTLKSRLEKEGLSYNELKQRYQKNYDPFQIILLTDVLVENSTYARKDVKRRIIANKLVDYKCALCQQTDMWNGKKLVLVLDHINGINNDNRIENLRFLCPNCNSQTSTFAGRNSNKEYRALQKIKKQKNLIEWSEKRRKVQRPSYEQLQQELNESNYCAVGRKYGVTDNTIRKWIKFYEKHGDYGKVA